MAHSSDETASNCYSQFVSGHHTQVHEFEKQVKEVEQFNQSSDALQNDCKNKGQEKTPTGSKKPLKRSSEEMQKEVMHDFSKILAEITEHDWALPFLLPVDVVGLGLHDYHQKIKKPMDFKTIKRKIKATDNSSYKNIHEIYEDVRLIFINAMKYNNVKTTIHHMAKSLLEIFENKWLELLPKVSNAESQLLKEESHKRLYKTLVPEATYANMARGLSTEIGNSDAKNSAAVPQDLLKGKRKNPTTSSDEESKASKKKRNPVEKSIVKSVSTHSSATESSSKDSRTEKLHDVDAGAPSGDVEKPTPGATIIEQSSSKGYSPFEDNDEENKEDSDGKGFHEGHSRMAPEPDFGLSDFQSKLQDNVVAVIEDFISSFGILGNSTAAPVSQSSETSKCSTVTADHLIQTFRRIAFESNPCENPSIILTLRPAIESFKQKLEVNKQLFSSTQLEGIQVVMKTLEDTFKVHDDFKHEKVVKGQYIQETEEYFAVVTEGNNKYFEQKKQFDNNSSKISEFMKKIKLLEAENEITSKNMHLTRSTVVTHVSKLSTLKTKIEASDEKMASLENKFKDLKNNYARLRESPPF